MTGGSQPWTEARFRQLAASALHVAPSDHVFDPRRDERTARSDFDLDPDLHSELDLTSPLRPAAVLVPIVLREHLTVLLTERSQHLPSHAGQIAFPGGKIEKQDPHPLETALRESEEEIGLDRTLVEPMGYLDNYRTGTGFHVIPVVALIRPEFSLTLDPSEVADAFEVPLAFLMSPGNHQRHQREWKGRMRTYYAMPFGDRYIWGATAGMIKNLHERIFAT
ncbi:MAG TPA: CoA pyrophosphatase [Hyphomicrobiaceae bacterium]|nr:CoA pyrophosphatase [Hyphomicrobiaceae bacterium]